MRDTALKYILEPTEASTVLKENHIEQEKLKRGLKRSLRKALS